VRSQRELYNLASDPFQLNNVYNTYANPALKK